MNASPDWREIDAFNGASVSAHVRPIPFEEGFLLLDRSIGRLHAYDAVAWLIWSALSAGDRPSAVCRKLAKRFGAPPEQVRATVSRFLLHWSECGQIGIPGSIPTTETSTPRDVRPLADSAPCWSQEWVCRIGPARIAFAVEHPEGADLIRRQFRHLEGAPGSADLRIEVRNTGPFEAAVLADGIEILRSEESGLLFGAIYQALLERVHGIQAWRALIHGGAVALDDFGIGLPAPSGSGKTTLVAALVAAGFDYAADDLLAVSAPDGNIVRCPMPLSAKSGSWPVLEHLYPELSGAPTYSSKGLQAKLILPPADSWLEPPVPLRALVFPTYRRGATAALTPLTPMEALTRLLNDRIWLGYPLTEEAVVEFLEWLKATPCFSLVHGSLRDAESGLRFLVTS